MIYQSKQESDTRQYWYYLLYHHMTVQ